MLDQILLGTVVSMANIAIHALVMITVIKVAGKLAARSARHPSLFLISAMTGTVSILMAAHVVEVAAWALAYRLVEAVPAGTDLMYFAFVNYTTLGYGDITPVKAWQLLGPITAMNGMLLFGWSAAIMFEVATRAMDLSGKRRSRRV